MFNYCFHILKYQICLVPHWLPLWFIHQGSRSVHMRRVGYYNILVLYVKNCDFNKIMYRTSLVGQKGHFLLDPQGALGFTSFRYPSIHPYNIHPTSNICFFRIAQKKAGGKIWKKLLNRPPPPQCHPFSFQKHFQKFQNLKNDAKNPKFKNIPKRQKEAKSEKSY